MQVSVDNPTPLLDEPAVFVVRVTNPSASASGAKFILTSILPVPFAFVSHDADPDFSCGTPAAGKNGPITCTLPSIPAASSIELAITAVARTASPGIFVTTVAGPEEDDTNAANNQATVAVYPHGAGAST